MSENLDILDKLYETRQYDFEEVSFVEREEIENQLHPITLEDVQMLMEKNVTEENQCQEIIKKLNELIENYEIKMAFYMKKRYKQGFKDAICLLEQCKK